jgi:hypothetical protein
MLECGLKVYTFVITKSKGLADSIKRGKGPENKRNKSKEKIKSSGGEDTYDFYARLNHYFIHIPSLTGSIFLVLRNIYFLFSE